MAETAEHEETGTRKEMYLESENGGKIKVIEVNGVVFPMPFFDSEEAVLKRLSVVKNLQYENGDVMICSFPKTGTHWTANIVHFLMQPNGPLEEMPSHSGWLIDLYDKKDTETTINGRLISSHLPPKLLPRDHFAKGGKTIIVFRNPKDAAVSMYYMMRKQKVVGDFSITWDKFLSYWIEGKTLFGSFFNYYKQWQEELENNPKMDVLIVQYEDLKKHPPSSTGLFGIHFSTLNVDLKLDLKVLEKNFDVIQRDIKQLLNGTLHML